MTGCKIGKITLKNGGCQLRSLPSSQHAVRVFPLGELDEEPWGEITFRCFDGDPITNESAVYMLRCAEKEIIGD